MVRCNRCGFTLTELLVVIGILLVIVAILLPIVSTTRENSRRTACISNERQLGIACLAYMQDNDEMFPEGGDFSVAGSHWVSAFAPYFKDGRILACPDDTGGQKVPSPPFVITSYGFNSDLGVNSLLTGSLVHGLHGEAPSGLTSPARTVMFFEVTDDANPFPFDAGGPIGNASDAAGDMPASSLVFANGTYEYANTGSTHPNVAALYATGNIGGRQLNGTLGSTPRHGEGSDYVACDGHVEWLRPEMVSSGDNALNPTCRQGNTVPQSPTCSTALPQDAAGTGATGYALTFSGR